MIANTLNSAYLIHARPFRETSLLINFFTENDGFISAVARGARTSGKNNKRGILQPFTPLLIDWRGNHDLVSLRNIELRAQPFMFKGNQLVLGLYVNEILYHLLAKNAGVAMPELFTRYESLLQGILHNKFAGSLFELEVKLREFELYLLDCLGYGLQFELINPDDYYCYDHEEGFFKLGDNVRDKGFLGRNILDIKNKAWKNKDAMHTAKVLLRNIIQYHTGAKELFSRKLYVVD